MRRLVDKYNKAIIVIFITLLSIFGTQVILRVYYFITKVEMRSSEIIAGIIAPLIVASVVSYYLVGIMKQLIELEKEMRVIANTDPATHLKSRRALLDSAEELFQIARRYKKGLGIILLDIDHFKEINDTHGHIAGDMVLRIIGNVINTSKRESDVAGRYGGDEILIILPETDEKGCVSFAEKIIRETKMYQQNKKDTISFTVSIGLTLFNDSKYLRLDELIDMADKALYTAKKKGRDNFYVYDLSKTN